MAVGGSLGSANLGVEVDPKRFSAGMKRIEAEFTGAVRRMDAQSATVDIDADLSELKRDLAKARLMIRDLENQKFEMKLEGGPKAERTIGAINRQILVYRKRVADLLNEQHDLNTSTKALTKTTTKHDLEINRLRSSYVKLKSEIDSLDPSFRLFTDRVQQIRLDQLNSELDDVRGRLRFFGQDTRDLDDVVDHHSGTLRRWASNLSEIRVHLGLVSLNLKQLSLVAGAGANLISGLVGAASSLVSVTGAGLIGALGVGTSALASFGLAGAGIIGILNPLIEDFGNATDAIKAYDDAVLKYGKDSTQAQTKMEQMERILGSLNARQREAISSVQQLGDRWRRLTAEARPAFFRTAAEGIQTLNDLMPMLAQRSVEAFEAASRGTERWFRGLRSAEAENIIGSMMRNATEALEPLLDGLGDLVTWFGRVAKSFSRFLPGIARGFEAWTQGLADGVANTRDLNKDVDGLMDSLSSLGRFLTTGVSLIHNFFAAGVGEGRAFLDSITDTLDRWNEWVKSAEGKNEIAEWMHRGIETTKSFVSAISELVKGLIQLGPVTRVVFEAFVAMVTAIGKISQVALSLPGVTSALRGLVAAFLGLTAGKAVAGIVTGLATAFGTLGRSLAGLAAGSAASGLAATGGGLAGLMSKLSGFARFIPGLGAAIGLGVGLFADFGGGASAAAENVARLSEETAALDAALGELASADATFIENRVNQARATRAVEDAQAKVNQLLADGKKGTDQFRLASEELQLAQAGLLRANTGINQSIKTFSTAHKEGAAAMQRSSQLMSSLGIEQDKQAAAAPKLIALIRAQWRTQQLNAQGLHLTEQQAAKAAQKYAGLGLSVEQLSRVQKMSRQEQEAWVATLTKGARVSEALPKKLANIVFGMNLSGRAAQEAQGKFRRLLQTYGQKLPALILKVNDQAAAKKLVNLADKANELGGPRARDRVLKILANDDNAKSKVERLTSLVDKLKSTKAELKVGADTKGAENDVKALTTAVDDIEDKDFEVSDRGTASTTKGRVDALLSSLARVQSKSINIHTSFTTSGKRPGGAMGGDVESLPMHPLGVSRHISKPTLLTGEEAPAHPEFVIATNPAYRQRNLGFLARAAQALGVPVLGFAKGGPIKGRFKVGAVPEDRVTGRFSQAQQAFQTARDKVKTLQDKEKQRQQDIKQDGKSSIPSQTAKIAAARENMRDKEATKDKWSRRLKAVREVNKDINLFQSSIDRAGTQMDLAQAKGNKGQFRNWRTVRRKQLLKLKETLNKAAAKAGDYPQFAQELKQRIASIKLELHELPNFEREEAVAPTLEDLLTKGEAKMLDRLRLDEVLASVTSDLGDDEAARKASLPFFEALFARLRASGAPTDVLEQVASEIISRRPDTSETGGTTGPSFGEQFFTLNKERFNLFRNFASNFIPAPTASQYNNPPSYAGGQAGPAGSQVTITNNFSEPPPDPHTWTKQQDYEVRAATA